jgi:hypothetical protein
MFLRLLTSISVTQPNTSVRGRVVGHEGSFCQGEICADLESKEEGPGVAGEVPDQQRRKLGRRRRSL